MIAHRGRWDPRASWVEHSVRIDVAMLRGLKRRRFIAGHVGLAPSRGDWSVGCEVRASCSDRLVAFSLETPWGPVTADVRLDSTILASGGESFYFVCPDCGRRARHLHLPAYARAVVCRECHGLKYRSQSTRLRRPEDFLAWLDRFRARADH